MKSTKRIKLDELDLKFLNELPLIAEVLTSTTSKVNQLFQPFYKRLYEQCSNNKPIGWEIDFKKTEGGIVYPFFSQDGESKQGSRHTELDNYFQIRSRVTFELKKEKKLLDQIEIACGLYYSTEDDYRVIPYFFFCIQYLIEIKDGLSHFPLSFYEGFQTKYKELRFDIWHPESQSNLEGMQIFIEVNSIESEIELAADAFIGDIVPAFLNYLDKERVK